jgi:hypothetical protein
MKGIQLVPLIFGILAALFLFLAFFDTRTRGAASKPARTAWFRIGVIFAAVTLYLLVRRG